MRKGVLIGIGLGLAGLFGLAVASAPSRKEKTGNPILDIEGFPAKNPDVYYDVMRKDVGWDANTMLLPTQQAKVVWEAQAQEFRNRQHEIAVYISNHHEWDGKFGASPDVNSKQSFLVYRPENTLARIIDGKITYGHQFTSDAIPWGWHLSDEFGRPYEGWGYGSNPLGMVLRVAQMVLPLVPGIGTGASAALAAAIALGQGKSLKDAALAGARASLPPGAQMAFDVGVGVANGQSIDESAIQALENQYPGSAEAYERGKEIAKHA